MKNKKCERCGKPLNQKVSKHATNVFCEKCRAVVYRLNYGK